MRYFMHKNVTLEIDLKDDGTFTKVLGLVMDVDGTGVAVTVGQTTSYYPWTRVSRMYM